MLAIGKSFVFIFQNIRVNILIEPAFNNSFYEIDFITA